MLLDNVDFYAEDTMRTYCHLYRKQEENLTKEDWNEIYRIAGNHIGFLVNWLAEKDGIDADFSGMDTDKLELVRQRKMLGLDLLLEELDGKLLLEDIMSDYQNFISSFYKTEYWQMYAKWVIEELCDLPFEFVGTWEEFDQFKPLVDQAYQLYLMKNGSLWERVKSRIEFFSKR